MASSVRRLLDLQIPTVQQDLSIKDTIFYALSLGIGGNPVDERELALVYERNLQAVPTMAVILAHPGFWPRDLDTGLDWTKIVHAEQELVLHRALPPAARITARHRVTEVVDKGAGKGVLVYFERTLYEDGVDAPLATMVQSMFCRGDGGIGSSTQHRRVPHEIPRRAPDFIHESPTLPQGALLYRLNGDWNPLHADPEIAHRAGFDRPILHGLATFGIAATAILKCACGNNAAQLAAISCRFTAPVFPGERLETRVWVEGPQVSFVTRVIDRDVIAINHGSATLRGLSV